MSTHVLIRHPAVGRVWLSRVEWFSDHVEGEAWDDSQRGSPYLPCDYPGEPVWMNFPLGCVEKVRPFPNAKREGSSL